MGHQATFGIGGSLGIIVARHFKFGNQIDPRGINEKNAKLDQRGSGMGHVTYFWNYGISYIRVFHQLVKL